MKKITSFLLILCMMLGVLGAATVSAADNEVLIGTPEVDGKIDDMYKQSLTIVYDGDPEKNAVANQQWDGCSATIYALYDDEFVYLAAEVKDNDVVSPDKTWLTTTFNPYVNDCIEFRIKLDGTNMFKVTMDAYNLGTFVLNNPGGVDSGIMTMENVKHESTITDDGYILELAVPHGFSDETDLLGTGKLGLKCWLRDLKAEAEGKVAPVSGTDEYMYSMLFGAPEETNHGAAVFYSLSNAKAADVSANAPDTFDVAIVAAVAAVASGAAFVIGKKRR